VERKRPGVHPLMMYAMQDGASMADVKFENCLMGTNASVRRNLARQLLKRRRRHLSTHQRFLINSRGNYELKLGNELQNI
jgi:hypothetical protein